MKSRLQVRIIPFNSCMFVPLIGPAIIGLFVGRTHKIGSLEYSIMIINRLSSLMWRKSVGCLVYIV
jgi:hypothetical protein